MSTNAGGNAIVREVESKPAVCVHCGREENDGHGAGWYIQWRCKACGNAQCQQLQPRRSA
jgi:hypothetical protein